MRTSLIQSPKWGVVLATGLGNIVEWYEFYLFAAMASELGRHFLPPDQSSAGIFLALSVFGVGFLLRPLGAIVFGRVGDLMGRKYTFLITIIVMGLATLNVGLLPGYSSIGIAAPLVFVAMRMLQGLALGGEYGGAITYVAEHAQPFQRGALTSWVQLSATVGLMLALVVVTATRWVLGEAAFTAWGWRIPFLLAFPLLLLSVWFRMAMVESPLFEQLRQTGGLSAAPVTEALGRWTGLRKVLLALFGLVTGQAVVWYASQFYALFFLTNVLHVDLITSNLLMILALLTGSPLVLFFGSLSDKIGRKPIILAGLLLAALTYMPLFERLTEAANPALAAAQRATPVKLVISQSGCDVLANPLIRDRASNSACDLARLALQAQSVKYVVEDAQPGQAPHVQIAEKTLAIPASQIAAGALTDANRLERANFREELQQSLMSAGYPAPGQTAQNTNYTFVWAILTLMVIYVAMVYGPMAAMLVELFPTRTRYTSVSVPYHIGNGWFGGFMPIIATVMVTQNGNPYFGLWYPICVAACTFVMGFWVLKETRGVALQTVS